MTPTRIKVGLGLVLVLAFMMALIAAASVASLLMLTRIDHPLEITACTPDTYQPGGVGPDGVITRGTPQSECSRPFALRNDAWLATEPITVAGQVCNEADEPVSYEVTVRFESVDTIGLDFTVIDVAITYDPGCQESYVFDFVFPVEDVRQTEPGSYGLWRLVGRADPVDSSRFAPYQWDPAATVELIAP